ncbi:MAG TPA: L,D-transpeptidase family protein [Tepidisphaeraceae bacterium]|jgi:lipoprotein-anchoring transpeptidase ErfK/SrfK
MSRTSTRISRAFIVLLAFTIIVGLVVYLRNPSHTKIDAPPVAVVKISSPSALEQQVKPAADLARPDALVTQTPLASGSAKPTTTQPTTAPVTSGASGKAADLSKAATASDRQPSKQPLIDGKAKFEGGDFLAARKILNDALTSGILSASEMAEAKSILQGVNKMLVFSSQRFANDEFGTTYAVQRGDTMAKIAANHDVTPELLSRINKISDPKRLQAGATIKVIQGPFHAVVRKSAFMMDLYFGNPGEKGSVYVTSFPVGLGKEDSTPTGTWLVEPHKKLKNPTYFSPRGEGRIDADDPKNPLGEFWIGLSGVNGEAVGRLSYGIHGTIEPDSIGKQSSMGCIRMHNEDVAIVYEMLVEGKSTVVVKD